MTMLFDEDIGVGETVEVTHDVPGAVSDGLRHAYFLNGGETQASVTLEWRVRPIDSATFHRAGLESLQNENLQDGRVYYPDVGGGTEIKLLITNEENEIIHVKVIEQHFD